jgi:hypothetical protein
VCKEEAVCDDYERWCHTKRITNLTDINATSKWGVPQVQRYLERRWMTTEGKSSSGIVLPDTLDTWAKAIVRKTCKMLCTQDLTIFDAMPWYATWKRNLYMYLPARVDNKQKSKVRLKLLLKVIKREFGTLDMNIIKQKVKAQGFSKRQRVVVALIQTYIPGCRLGDPPCELSTVKQ